MRRIMFVVFVILLLNLSLVSAHTQQELNEAKRLIDSKADCKSLTDSQLEIIGEYYMEQMHPGEAHETMDKMMGGEGSDSLRQMHIQIAKRLYCNEDVGGMMGMMGSGGMMPMMMNMMGGSMMSGQNPQTNMMQGMMGNYGYGFGYWNFLNVLYVILLIGLIILVYLWILKLWRNMKNKGSKK